MKKRNSFAILAFSAAFLLAACGEQPAESSTPASTSSLPAEATVTVTFDTDGGSIVPAQTIAKGSKATRPADPTKEGYIFDDWYSDAICVTLFDFDQPINANTTVYAGWEEEMIDTDDSSDVVDDNLLYFKDASWWNAWGAYTVAKFDDGDPTKMTWISFNPVVDASTGFNFWSIEVPEEATTVTFYRSWDDPAQEIEMDLNGPKTPALTLSEATGNMYDISATEANWEGAEIVGAWATYDPTDIPDIDSGEDSTPSGEEIDTISTKYGLKNIDTGKFICALEETDPNEGYDQAKAEGVSFAQGTKFALCDSESEGQPTWICEFNPWSFGSNGDSANISQYLTAGEGYWEVVQDFTADIYAQFKYEADRIYFGLK